MLIIGKQQWGYTIESNGQEDYKYFPISFGSQCYAVSLGSTYNLQSDAYSWIENVDKEKFLIGLGHNYLPTPYPTMFYMAIGEQQWGLTEEAYLPTIDFPVSFTSIPAVVGTPIKDYATSENYFGNNSIESVTASSFVPRQTNTNGGTKAGAIRYIAVGY